MKKLTQFVTEAKQGLDIAEDSVNYLSTKQLDDYLNLTQNFLSPEAEAIITWLKVNNANYIKDLSTGETDNALADFYNKGVPEDEHLKELYKWIGTLKKNGRLLEVPVFQTQEQFDDILNKKCTLDDVVLDLTTEKGRNAVAKRYEKLAHKIAHDWVGKSSFDEDELFSYCLYGLTYAMNHYGQPSNKAKAELEQSIADARKKAEELGEDPDEAEKLIKQESEDANKKLKGATFLTFASYHMRQTILGAIKDESHTVRIPVSQQQRIKKEQGQIAKSYDVSGDDKVGHDEDGARTVWDMIGDQQPTGAGIDKEETRLAKEKFMAKLKEKVGPRNFEWIENSYKENDDPTKLSNGEMAKKWKVSPGAVSTVVSKAAIQKLVLQDKELKKLAYDWFERFEECKHDEIEAAIDPTKPVKIGEYKNKSII